jgi:hypothetical protein
MAASVSDTPVKASDDSPGMVLATGAMVGWLEPVVTTAVLVPLVLVPVVVVPVVVPVVVLDDGARKHGASGSVDWNPVAASTVTCAVFGAVVPSGNVVFTGSSRVAVMVYVPGPSNAGLTVMLTPGKAFCSSVPAVSHVGGVTSPVNENCTGVGVVPVVVVVVDVVGVVVVEVVVDVVGVVVVDDVDDVVDDVPVPVVVVVVVVGPGAGQSATVGSGSSFAVLATMTTDLIWPSRNC